MSTIVMTGATRGIGRFAAERIASASPDDHLVVLARGRSGREICSVLRRTGASVDLIEADLLSLASIRAAVDDLRARLDAGAVPPLRALMLNAGAQFTNNRTESADGIEATFAVNVLANHVLVRGLQDRLVAPARIVITVSDTHFGDLRHNLAMVPGPQWKDPEVLARPGAFPNPSSTTAGRTAYSTSKLAAIHLVHEYARRIGPGIDIVGYNPGLVPGTELTRDADVFSRFAMRRIMPALARTPLASTPHTAGCRLARLVLGESAAPTGGYVDRDRVAPSSTESYDSTRERRLWDVLEGLAGVGS